MIQSMTGYGKHELEIQNYAFTIEIKSLNSKQLDLSIRMPQNLKSFEMQLRSLVAKNLYRGKVDVNIYFTEGKGSLLPKANIEAGMHYYKELQKLEKELGTKSEESLLSLIVKMPEVFTSAEDEWTDNDLKLLEEGMENTLNHVIAFRKQEGSVLEDDFKLRINRILELLIEVDEFETDRITKIKERIKNTLEQLGGDIQFDNNRLEQELIYYIEKLDVTEEKVRLKKHCEYFLEIIDKEEKVGKKLGFVLQEIGREINTLGSKANDASMQKLVVLMKDELEKIKEQMLNVL